MGTEKENTQKTIGSKVILFIIIIIFIVLIGIGFYTVFPHSLNSNEEASSLTTSKLVKIIEIDELSTFQSIYNGIATVMNTENSDEIDFYVYYEATIKAGINFQDIDIQIDDVQQIVFITLPPIEITSTNVDIGSLDYIFINEKANTNTVSERAYDACLDDVAKESSDTNPIYDLAEQNAHNIISALLNPFLEQSYDDYILEIE